MKTQFFLMIAVPAMLMNLNPMKGPLALFATI